MFPRNPHSPSRFRVWRRLGLITLLTLAPVTAGQVNPASKTRLPVFTYVRAAQPTPKARPGERRALTISTGQRELNLTLGQLQAMPAVRYTTHHPQLKRSFTYEGVTLRDLAARGGFLGRDLRVYAANGFASTIRAEDYLNWPIMLAYRADGAPIPILQKGPLTVVLPERPERFHAGEYSAAWVWFAERIAPAQ